MSASDASLVAPVIAVSTSWPGTCPGLTTNRVRCACASGMTGRLFASSRTTPRPTCVRSNDGVACGEAPKAARSLGAIAEGIGGGLGMRTAPRTLGGAWDGGGRVGGMDALGGGPEGFGAGAGMVDGPVRRTSGGGERRTLLGGGKDEGALEGGGGSALREGGGGAGGREVTGRGTKGLGTEPTGRGTLAGALNVSGRTSSENARAVIETSSAANAARRASALQGSDPLGCAREGLDNSSRRPRSICAGHQCG